MTATNDGLGHSSAAMSEVYGDADLEKARRVMEQAGSTST